MRPAKAGGAGELAGVDPDHDAADAADARALVHAVDPAAPQVVQHCRAEAQGSRVHRLPSRRAALRSRGAEREQGLDGVATSASFARSIAAPESFRSGALMNRRKGMHIRFRKSHAGKADHPQKNPACQTPGLARHRPATARHGVPCKMLFQEAEARLRPVSSPA